VIGFHYEHGLMMITLIRLSTWWIEQHIPSSSIYYRIRGSELLEARDEFKI